jgi:hypothetical protein
MLSFNPYFRMTAYECLKHEIFNQVRNPSKEKIIEEMRKSKAKYGYDSPHIIQLQVDRDEAFDYENSDVVKYTVKDLKNFLAKEIIEIKHDIQHKNKNLKKLQFVNSGVISPL